MKLTSRAIEFHQHSSLVRSRILCSARSLLLGLAILVQPPSQKARSSGEGKFPGFATAAWAVAKTYKAYNMSGMITDPSLEETVLTSIQCGQKCAAKLVCSAFSVKKQDNDRFLCRIALGDFRWESNSSWVLFMEDIGPLNGYTLKMDGRFYKFVNASVAPSMTLPRSREMCWAEGGDLGVAYPKFRRDAQRQGVSFGVNQLYFTGMTMPDWNSQRWVTDDGYSFFKNQGDPDQPWDANVGWSSTPIITENENPNGWYYVPRGEWRLKGVMCRKDNLYRKLPPNGTSNAGPVRYYKMHYQPATADQAARACADEGGALANLYAPGAWDAVEGYRVATYTTVTSGSALGKDYAFTIGGRVGPAWGSWILPDGTTSTTKTSDPSQHWASGEPNDGIGGANTTLSFMPSGGIGDVPADRLNQRFLCEIVVNV